MHERVPVRAIYRLFYLLLLIVVPSSPQDFALYIISFAAPLILQWIINLATIRTLWDAHNSALGRKTSRPEDVDVRSSERLIIQSCYRLLLLVLLRKLSKSRWDVHVQVMPEHFQLCCIVDPLARPSQTLLIVANQTRERSILPLAFPLRRYVTNRIAISSTTASEASQVDIRAVW